jgi:hypothetical protein
MRVFGTSLGVASASTVLSWRIAAKTGISDRTLAVAEQALLGAVRDVLWLLVIAAAIAGVTCLLGDRQAPELAGKPAA